MASAGYLWVATGLDKQLTGIERVAIACVRALAEVDDHPQTMLVDRGAQWPQAITDIATVHAVERPRGGVARRVRAHGFPQSMRTGPLVTHSFGAPPPRVLGPKSYTVHDWSPWRDSGMPAQARLGWMMAICAGIRAADLVHFYSAATAAEAPHMVRRMLNTRRMVHGLPFPPPPPEPSAESPRAPGSILSVGTDVPRKRFALLSRACAAVPGSRLTLVGQGTQRYGADSLGASSNMRGLGRVSDATLTELYSTTHLVALISEYEGFGLPALEAWTHGCGILLTEAVARRLPAEVVSRAHVVPTDLSCAALARELKSALSRPLPQPGRITPPEHMLVTLLAARRALLSGGSADPHTRAVSSAQKEVST